jgi:hypothetical protein
MTEKKMAANRRNQKFSNGPATDEGRERIRAAHLRHGFYAKAEDIAMRALGEDPAHFQELLEGLWETYHPADAAQEGLVIRLARATWLMNRADRMQEGYAVRQAQDVNIGREDRRHVQMMRLKMTADSLRLLVQSVARAHYVTTPADLEKMKSLRQEGMLKEMGEIALALFYQLQPPGTGEDGLDEEESARRVVRAVKDIFGIGMQPEYPPPAHVAPASSQPQESQQVRSQDSDGVHRTPETGDAGATGAEKDARYPKITAAEWEARERPRQLLENILTRQVEICEAQRKALLKESVAGPSPYERAAEIAPTHPNAQLMRRMQDSNFREVRRVTSLLLKLKRHEHRMKLWKNTAVCHDISETKRVNNE